MLKKIICLLSLVVASSTANASTTELNRTASCAGVVLGFAAAEYGRGNKGAFEDGFEVGYLAYFAEFLHNSHSKSDRELAEKILSANTDKIIGAVNAGAIDLAFFEEVIHCTRFAAKKVYDRRDVLAENEKKVSDFISQKRKEVAAMLSATFD